MLAGAAFSVKSLLELPALVAAGLIVIDRRRIRDILTVPAIALAISFLVAVPWGLQRVYDQSVAYHTDQAQHREIWANATKTMRTLLDRDAPLLAAGVVAVVAALIVRRRSRNGPRSTPTPSRELTDGLGPIVVWLFLGLAVLLLEAPMWRNHLAHVAPAAALLIGAAATTPRIATAIALAAVVVLPWHVAHLSELLWPRDYTGTSAQIVHLRAGSPARSPGDQRQSRARLAGREAHPRPLRRRLDPAHRLAPTRAPDRPAHRRPRCAATRGLRGRTGLERPVRIVPRPRSRARRSGYRVALGGAHHEQTVWIRRRCRPPRP